MRKRFEHKVAIITGGGSGIGLEAAKQLVDEGAKVVINGRNKNKLEAAASEIDSSGVNIQIFAGDIGDYDTAYGLIKKAEDEFGGVDILLNNAGWFTPTPFLDHTEELYDSFVDTILKGRFFAAQAAVIAMKKRGGGVIVNTGSMWGKQAVSMTPSSAHSVAYAGVHMLTKSVAIEHAIDNIRSNAVVPAVVETPAFDVFLTPEQRAEMLPTFDGFHPLGRNGQPIDVVNAILFLASDEASWVTGTVMNVDGGVLAGS